MFVTSSKREICPPGILMGGVQAEEMVVDQNDAISDEFLVGRGGGGRWLAARTSLSLRSHPTLLPNDATAIHSLGVQSASWTSQESSDRHIPNQTALKRITRQCG